MLAHIYEDVVAANFDGIARNPHRRIGCKPSVRNIVFPAVPGTYDDLPLKFAFAERTASVQAYIIDCKQFTRNIGERDILAIQLKFADCAGRNLVFLCSPQKGHLVAFSVLAVPPPNPDSGLSWFRRLSHHHAALEFIHHAGLEADGGGALGQRHLINFVLQF